MIRVNLLPVKEQLRVSAGIRQLTIMAAVVLVAALIMGAINFHTADKIAEQKESNRLLRDEISRLEKLIGEVNQLQKDKDKLANQLAVIRKLEQGKTGPVRMLDALATLIPKRVWLKSLEQHGDAIHLEGEALENADVSAFMTALDKDPMFSDVVLKGTRKERPREGGRSLYTFTIEAKVSYH